MAPASAMKQAGAAAALRTTTPTTLTISRLQQPRQLVGQAECQLRRFATGLKKQSTEKKERVVILGSGWAGYTFARSLDPARYERVIVSPRSHFVFTPLLASTAVGTLEFRATLEPVRRLPGAGVQFHQGWADDVDWAHKVVRVEESRQAPEDQSLASQTILPEPEPEPPKHLNGALEVSSPPPKKGPVTDVPYDKLVVAVGAYSQTFGVDGVRQHAHFLRDVGDARRIRLRVLSLFEQCASPSLEGGDAARRRLLHFAIVGGGPTGIEFAAELHDLVHHDLARVYPSLLPHVRVTVYDIAPTILPMFDQALTSYAMGLFRRQHIHVRTGHSIRRIRPDPASPGGLALNVLQEDGAEEQEVGAGMVVWSTGLMQNPLVEKLAGKSLRDLSATSSSSSSSSNTTSGSSDAAPTEYLLEKDPKTGGIITDDRLRARLVAAGGSSGSGTSTDPAAQRLDDVFVIGDCAVVDGHPNLPKTAQVASQQAAYLARALNKGTLDDKPFRFRNLGTMTYLGSWKAIHQSSADHLTGWAAWVLWRTAYLTRSMSLKNKVLIPVYWFVSWAFGRDISRF